MRRKTVSAFALMTSAALLLSACGGGGAGDGSAGQQVDSKPGEIGAQDEILKRPAVQDMGEVAIAVEEGFSNYNNYIGATNNFASTIALSNMIPSPYTVDLVDGKAVMKVDGDLMESIKVTSASPQTIEWKVRKEAVWSDGVPIDCKDFHLKWLAATTAAKISGTDGKSTSIFDTNAVGYENIEKLECSDGGKTITTTFFADKAYADYRGLFSVGSSDGLLPAHVVEKKAGIEDITKIPPSQNDDTIKKLADFYTKGWTGWDKETALSGGPYIITSTDLRDQTVLERNPKWWGNPGGPSKVIIKTNRDAQSAAQQLQNKEVLAIAPQADNAVAQTLRGSDAFVVYTNGGQTYEHIDMNMANPLFAQNKELRDAFAACVPRTEIVEKLVQDVQPNAKPLGNFVFMPNEVGYEDHYTDLPDGDAEAAKKLMQDGGWTLGADGIFTKGEFRASFKVGHKTNQRRADTMRLVGASCKNAGIEVIADQSAEFNDKRLQVSEFEAALFAWVGGPTKGGTYGNYAQRSKGGTANYANYDSAKVTETWAQANGELNYEKRVAMMNEIDKTMRQDMFSVPLFQHTDFAASAAELTPVSYIGVGGGVTWNMYAWQKK